MNEHNPPPGNSLDKNKGEDNKTLQPVFDFETPGIGVRDIKAEAHQLLKQDNETAETEITGEYLLQVKIEQIPCLIEPLLQLIGLACLAGSSDTGKSSLLRQLDICIVTGDSKFLGFTINAKHKSVIYVSTEDDQSATSYLLNKQASVYKPEQLKGLRFVFDTDNLLTELDARLTHKPADLIIIDCFADSYGGNLKETQEIRTFLHPYQQLAAKHQCLILFLHHTGKRTENLEPSKNNLLSGQGFEAKMRLVIELRADQMNPNQRHLCIVKGNYLPTRYKKESFVLQFDEQNFTFSNTGESIPFELLVRQPDTDNSKTKWEQAKELKDKGQNYEQIANAIGYNSKGSVTKLFDKAKRNGWGKDVSDNVSNGNEGNQ